MSAIVTGVKTDIGVFGVDEAVQPRRLRQRQGRELLSPCWISPSSPASARV
jgi:hypothetical protein